MGTITGGNVIAGSRERPQGDTVDGVGEVGPFKNAGAPTNGTSGTFANIAAPGALLIDTTNKAWYYNNGTLASPTWAAVTLP